MVCHLCRPSPFPDYPRLVRNVSDRGAEDASDRPRTACGSNVDLVFDGYNKECGGQTTTRLVVALQTL